MALRSRKPLCGITSRCAEVLTVSAIACACCFLMAGALDWWAGMLGLSAVVALSLAWDRGTSRDA